LANFCIHTSISNVNYLGSTMYSVIGVRVIRHSSFISLYIQFLFQLLFFYLFYHNIYWHFYFSNYYSLYLYLTIQILNSNSWRNIHHIPLLFPFFIYLLFIDFSSTSVYNCLSHFICHLLSPSQFHFYSIRSFCQISHCICLINPLL